MADQSYDTVGLIDRRTVLQIGAGLATAGPALLRARRETNESSASEERRNRIANALGATRARKAILGG